MEEQILILTCNNNDTDIAFTENVTKDCNSWRTTFTAMRFPRNRLKERIICDTETYGEQTTGHKFDA